MLALLAVPEEKPQIFEVGADGVDLMVTAAGRTLAVEAVDASSAEVVAAHAEPVAKSAKATNKRATPLLAVPFMGESTNQACQRAGVSWVDFSGNARIIAPGIRVIVDGRQFGRSDPTRVG